MKTVANVGVTYGLCKTNCFHKRAQPSLSSSFAFARLFCSLPLQAKSLTMKAKRTNYSKTIAAICLLSRAALALFSHKPQSFELQLEFGNVKVLQGCDIKLIRLSKLQARILGKCPIRFRQIKRQQWQHSGNMWSCATSISSNSISWSFQIFFANLSMLACQMLREWQQSTL